MTITNLLRRAGISLIALSLRVFAWAAPAAQASQRPGTITRAL